MNVILDTCTFLWLVLPQGRLSDVAVGIIDDPSSKLFLTEISILEISLKHSVGKLPLPDPPKKWLPKRLKFFHVQTIPLSLDAIYRSGELPRLHPDPFDRLIAAQAIESGMTILSPYTPISLLGASRVW